MVKNELHTKVVERAISRSSPNRVLGVIPPAVDKSQGRLPRVAQVVLSQLRSGHCARLRDYQARIGRSPSDLCLGCNLEAQTVKHIFDCPARPTTLTTDNLWTSPLEVVDFLSRLPEFADLPPLHALPPARPLPARPPPRPPDSPIFTPMTPPISPFPFTPPSPSSPLSVSPPSSPLSLMSLSFSF